MIIHTFARDSFSMRTDASRALFSVIELLFINTFFAFLFLAEEENAFLRVFFSSSVVVSSINTGSSTCTRHPTAVLLTNRFTALSC